MYLVWFLLIGLLAGFLATRIMKTPELSLAGNLLLGVIGAVIGGFLLGLLGLRVMGLLGQLVAATVGAIALIWIASRIKRP